MKPITYSTMPEISQDDQRVIREREAQLLKPQDQIVNESMANVAQSAMIGSGPQSLTPNLAANALRARSQQRFDAQINDMLQKQKYASYGKRAQNLGQAQKESLTDAERLSSKYGTLNKLNLAKDALDIDTVLQDFDERIDIEYQYLQERGQDLSNWIYIENVRRKAEAERNAMLNTILGGIGTVVGAGIGLVASGGNPMGAMAGGAAGSKLAGSGNTQYDPLSAPRRGGDY